MAEDNNLDLLPLLNLIRGIQAAGSTLAPEPQPDLPNGYSPEQAQRWIAWRNAKIQAAQVPQPVKDNLGTYLQDLTTSKPQKKDSP